ncbi:MAG: hypothetical protein ACOX4H_04655 [Bacillota bacterium]|nr:hypothetical protein [Clostridia bacterium]
MRAKDGADWRPSIKKFCTMACIGKEITGVCRKIIKHYRSVEAIKVMLTDEEKPAKH